MTKFIILAASLALLSGSAYMLCSSMSAKQTPALNAPDPIPMYRAGQKVIVANKFYSTCTGHIQGFFIWDKEVIYNIKLDCPSVSDYIDIRSLEVNVLAIPECSDKSCPVGGH